MGQGTRPSAEGPRAAVLAIMHYNQIHKMAIIIRHSNLPEGVGSLLLQGVTELTVVGRQIRDNDATGAGQPVFTNTCRNHEGLVFLALVGEQTTDRKDVLRADPAMRHVPDETGAL